MMNDILKRQSTSVRLPCYVALQCNDRLHLHQSALALSRLWQRHANQGQRERATAALKQLDEEIKRLEEIPEHELDEDVTDRDSDGTENDGDGDEDEDNDDDNDDDDADKAEAMEDDDVQEVQHSVLADAIESDPDDLYAY
jgi:uncharacterized protein YjiS (DUF1127 family)